nr:hypothetical protein [Deltaproteobacteria bacterium]
SSSRLPIGFPFALLHITEDFSALHGLDSVVFSDEIVNISREEKAVKPITPRQRSRTQNARLFGDDRLAIASLSMPGS